MNAVLILNREAGAVNGDRDAVSVDALRDAFRAAGCEVAVQVAPPAQLKQSLQDAIRARPSSVIVGGGDGTISTAAACLADTGIALGVLPLGTLNHFARDLGLPGKWPDAVSALAHGEIRSVDLGEVNGCPFINNCSIGSYAEAVRARDRLRRDHGRGKWVAMAIASFAVFRRLRRFRVRIELPDTSLELRTPFVFVGNNRYSGHLLSQSLRPRLDESQLSFYTTRAKRHFTLLRLAWQSLTRSLDEAEGLESHFGPEAVITSLDGQPLPVALDGELAHLTPPLRFRIRPGALQVIGPPSATPAMTPPLAASAHA